jgi:uncharacterized protein YndB with AHSA1/START domain
MSELTSLDVYAALTEPATLTLQRLLPGPIERVWAYLTDSDLRRKWLAAGEMELQIGAPFELVWRNDEISDPPGQRPADKDREHRIQSRILECDPPRRLVFAWPDGGDVAFDLVAKGNDVLLTVTHRRIATRDTMVMIGAGWHGHLDVLVARLTGRTVGPFWDVWNRLRDDYERRLPA